MADKAKAPPGAPGSIRKAAVPKAKARKKAMTATERSHILEMTATGQNNNNDSTAVDVTLPQEAHAASKPGEGDLTELVPEDTSGKGDTSTRAHTSYNYINSILGSGVIGMPYALHQAGVGLGLVLLVFIAALTDYSLRLMIRGGELSGSYSYQGMMEVAFGRPGYYLLTLLQLIYPCIAMVSYNVIVGNTFTKVLGAFHMVGPNAANEVALERESVIVVATIFVTLPLSHYRCVSRMSKVSFLSLVAIAFILVAILTRMTTLDVDSAGGGGPPTSWRFFGGGFIEALGIYSFAFMCHHNTFMIYGAMQNRSPTEWGTVTHISIGTALAVSIVFSLGGYATFKGLVQGDLLENYCWDDTLINVARASFAITIMLTFPLECFVARDVLEQFFFKGKAHSTARHFLLTLLIVSTACILSMTTDCLGVTLELNGLLAAIPLAYILPAACFLKLEPSRFLSRTKAPAIATAAFGLLVSLTGLGLLIFRGSNSSENCSHDAARLPYCGSPIAFMPTLPTPATSPALDNLTLTNLTI